MIGSREEGVVIGFLEGGFIVVSGFCSFFFRVFCVGIFLWFGSRIFWGSGIIIGEGMKLLFGGVSRLDFFLYLFLLL